MSTVAEMALDRLVAEVYAPVMTPAEVARDLLTFVRALKNPAGEFVNQGYEPTLHPAHLFFLSAVISGVWKNFLIVADTQSGKSWLIQCVIFYALCEQKADVLYGLPNMRFASDVWMNKIRKAMQIAGLREFLPTSGSGSGGGTEIDTVYMQNAGALSFFGSGGHHKSGGNDGRTIPNIVNDELDSLPLEVVNKNDARADAYFRKARRYKATTVKDDDDSHGLNFLAQSTNAHLEYECPQCHRFTPLDTPTDVDISKSQLSYDPTSDQSAKASVRLACIRCGVKDAFDEARRQVALRNPRLIIDGKAYVPEDIQRGIINLNDLFGIRWACFDNPFKDLGDKIAVKHRRAKIEYNLGRSKSLIDLFHDDFARQFPREQQETDLDAIVLAHRSTDSSYAKGVVPAPATFVTIAVDQQKRVLVWLARAHAPDGRTWLVDWGLVNICGERDEPTREQRKIAYQKTEEHVLQGWPWNSHIMKPVIAGMDVADWPDIAAEYMRDKSFWMPLHGAHAEMVKKLQRGDGKDLGKLPGWYQLKQQKAHGGEWVIMWIDHDDVKHELARSLKRPNDSTAAAMIPKGLGASDRIIEHLTSERWEKNPETGKWQWIKVGRFNDYWDCMYYTHALGQYWLTEHPGWQPHNAETNAQRDDDDEPELGGWN